MDPLEPTCHCLCVPPFSPCCHCRTIFCRDGTLSFPFILCWAFYNIITVHVATPNFCYCKQLWTKNDNTINLINESQLIVIQKQYMFSGNLLARTKISKHITSHCNKLLIHRNNKCVTAKAIKNFS